MKAITLMSHNETNFDQLFNSIILTELNFHFNFVNARASHDTHLLAIKLD